MNDRSLMKRQGFCFMRTPMQRKYVTKVTHRRRSQEREPFLTDCTWVRKEISCCAARIPCGRQGSVPARLHTKQEEKIMWSKEIFGTDVYLHLLFTV